MVLVFLGFIGYVVWNKQQATKKAGVRFGGTQGKTGGMGNFKGGLAMPKGILKKR